MAARRRVEGWYRKRLAEDARIRLQCVHPEVEMSWFVFVVRLSDMYEQCDRDRVLQGLTAHGIGCSNYFAPIHLQPFYADRFGCEYRPEVVEYLLSEHYRPAGRALRRCHPRDLLKQIRNYCRYRRLNFEMCPEHFDRVVKSYFAMVLGDE